MSSVNKIVDATAGKYLDQADAVRTLSQFTGATATETSKLIEIFDDAGVESDSLKAAMRKLADDGLTPNVETIAKLSDEYNALSGETERANFLTDTFGARGAELGKVFEKTGAQIREAGVNIKNAMSEEDIQNAEQVRQSLDAINDSWTAINNTIMRRILPGNAAALEGFSLIIDALAGKFQDATEGATMSNEEFRDSLAKNVEALYGIDGAAEEAGQRYYELGQRALAYSRTGETLNQTLASQKKALDAVSFAVSGQLGKAYKDFGSTTRDIEQRAGALRAEMQLAIDQGYSPTGRKVSELRAELDGLNGEYTDAYTAMQATTAEMIYQQAAASGLAAGPLLELGRSLGLVSENDYNLITATQLLNDKFADQSDPNAYNAAMMALYDAAKDGALTLQEVDALMKSLDGKVSNSNININTNYTTTGTPPAGSGSAYGPGTGGNSTAGGGANPTGPKVNDKIAPPPPERRASGGPVDKNTMYTWQEPGAEGEAFVSKTGGYVLNKDDAKQALASGGGVNIAPGAIVINGGNASAEAIAQQVIVKITAMAERNRRSGVTR